MRQAQCGAMLIGAAVRAHTMMFAEPMTYGQPRTVQAPSMYFGLQEVF